MNNVNILIIGNGAREYAIARTLRLDPRVIGLYISPENPAASKYLQAKSISYENHDDLLKSIKKEGISLVIIGPEAPLMQGTSDFLTKNGLLVFGASLANARLEGSKAYMKKLASRLKIPTARYKEINLQNINEGLDFIDSLKVPIVLKADGLCGGKGVLILDSKDEAKERLGALLRGELFGKSGEVVVIEEYLDGYELSVFAVANGKDYALLPACQDHKRLLDNDLGPNTGGMGAYTKLPTNLYNEELEKKIKSRILNPTFSALKADGNPYTGVLFAGLMVVGGEPHLLEYNVRFGDPECEVLLPLLDTPLLDIAMKCARGEELGQIKLKNLCSVGVVMSSGDYARSDATHSAPAVINIDENLESSLYAEALEGKELDSRESSLKAAISKGSHIAFGATALENGILLAKSGRVMIAIGVGENLHEARLHAYALVDHISFEGKHYRKDIAHQALGKM